jgi:hypothetical protein
MGRADFRTRGGGGMSYYGVHNTHCCKKHGCKYQDEDCPVEHGDAPGVKCEDCHDEENDPLFQENARLRKALEGLIHTWNEGGADGCGCATCRVSGCDMALSVSRAIAIAAAREALK